MANWTSSTGDKSGTIKRVSVDHGLPFGRCQKSGRGRGYIGRSSRTGGRGRGKLRSSSHFSQAAKPAVSKTLGDHIHTVGSAKQASNCSVISAFIVIHIQKTFEYGDDIRDALESRQETVFRAPTLQPADPSLSGNPKAITEKWNEILCRAEVTAHVTHKDKCHTNEGKAFALIHSYCNKAMQHKLQTRTDCKSSIKGDPIKLLDEILGHSMSYMENKYRMSMVVDGIKNGINLRQKEDESLVDCTCWFKAAMNVLESHIGGDPSLPKLAKMDPKCKDNCDPNADPPESALKQCLKRAHKRFSTHLHMENVDWTK